jgi:NADPH2:quinone reductase
VLPYGIAKLKNRHPDWFRADLGELFQLLADRRIEPVIAARMPLTEAHRAHELLGRAAVEGKLVLIP